MDDELATVIPFPVHRLPGSPPALAVSAPAKEEYWALVQRLAAERRRLATTEAG